MIKIENYTLTVGIDLPGTSESDDWIEERFEKIEDTVDQGVKRIEERLQNDIDSRLKVELD